MAIRFEDYVVPVSIDTHGYNDVELTWAARGILWWLRVQDQPVRVRDIFNARDGVSGPALQEHLERLVERGYITVKTAHVMSPEERARVSELERTIQYLSSEFVQRSFGDDAKRAADDMILTLRERIEILRRGEAL